MEMKSQSVAKFLFVLGVLGFFILSAMNARLKANDSLKNLPQWERIEGRENENDRAEAESIAEEEKERGDHAFDAMRFRRLQMQDEKGNIPIDGMEKARQHVKTMRVSGKGDAKQTAGVKPDSWTWLGPGNAGGRIRSIVIHPTNTSTMWVGSVGGGIWRTDNGGTSWFPVNDFLANLAVSTMVISPTIPSTMYAGTGESFASNTGNPGNGLTPDGIQGQGVFKSTNSGVSWNQLASTDPTNSTVCPNPATCPWLYVNRLAISPDGNTILAATWQGIFQSLNGGTSWNPTNATGNWMDIDFHPTDSQRAIASASGFAAYSLNAGGFWTGASFPPPPAPPITGRVEIAYAPNSPTIVYATVDQNNGDLYRSTNGGQSYTQVNTGTSFFNSSAPCTAGTGSQGSYDNILWVKPQDASFVIVGGIDLWRSTNSGTNFTRISQWCAADSVHADHHMIVAHPGFNNNTNRTVYFSNDGGMYRTDNIDTVAPTSGWVNLNNNLGITQFYGAAGSFTTDTFGNPTPVIIGGAQDNGTLRYSADFGNIWLLMKDGDGGYCAADPTDPSYFYGEYTYLQIHRSPNGGFQSAYIYPGITDAGNAATANFIAPFILDPNNPNTMLAGGIHLWRTTDVKALGVTWSSIWGPTGDNSPSSAIAVAPGSSDIICVGHNNGDIYLTSNGTQTQPTWFKIDRANVPNRMVTRLVIDPNHFPYYIYATFGGFSPDNVYRSTDQGATWTDITGTGATGLPNVPVRSLVYHPRNPDILYVGTEIGIFSSDDAGATWDVTQGGPANVSVDELFWLGEDLIAATHGRGLYKASGGIYVDCSYTGNQLGTFDQPYRTLGAAVNAVTNYTPVWLRPCNYNEQITINKRLELRSYGGTVTIGRP
jgi:hypothetical protein